MAGNGEITVSFETSRYRGDSQSFCVRDAIGRHLSFKNSVYGGSNPPARTTVLYPRGQRDRSAKSTSGGSNPLSTSSVHNAKSGRDVKVTHERNKFKVDTGPKFIRGCGGTQYTPDLETGASGHES